MKAAWEEQIADWAEDFAEAYEESGFNYRNPDSSKHQQDNTNGETVMRDDQIIGFGHMLSTERAYKFDQLGVGTPAGGNTMLYVTYPRLEIKGTFDESHPPECEWCNGDENLFYDCKRRRKDRHIAYMFGEGARAHAGITIYFLDDLREIHRHDAQCERADDTEEDGWGWCFCSDRNRKGAIMRVPYHFQELVETNEALARS